jgi:hypothetical protein
MGWFRNMTGTGEENDGTGVRPEKKSKKEKKEKKRKEQPLGLSYMPPMERRSSAEVDALVEHWRHWIHPRADDFYKLDEVLKNIAKNVSKGQDPVTSGADNCIFWYGDTSEENGNHEGIMEIDRQSAGGTQRQVVYTNRMLVYLFATEDSFRVLMKLPKAPFRMACDHPLCINLGHVDTQEPEPPPPQLE